MKKSSKVKQNNTPKKLNKNVENNVKKPFEITQDIIEECLSTSLG